MSPEGPRFATPETGKGEDKKDNKGKKKLRFMPPAPAVTEPQAERPAPSRQPRLPNETLATILSGKDQATETTGQRSSTPEPKQVQADRPKDTPKNLESDQAANAEVRDDHAKAQPDAPEQDQASKAVPEASVETTDASDNPDTATETADQPAERYDFPTRQLDAEAGELGTGEGVIHLNSGPAVIEQVVALREPTAAVSTERTPQTVFSRQSERAPSAGQEQLPELPASRQPEGGLPPEPEASSGGGGEKPPTEPSVPAAAGSGEPDRQPVASDMEIIQPAEAALYGGEALPRAATAVSSSERPMTKQELDQAFARSAAVHEQRGLLSGLFVGTLFANRKLRRGQKQEAKQLRRQAKRIEQLEKASAVASTTQERQARTSERALRALDKRFENTSRPSGEAVPAGKPYERRSKAGQAETPETVALPANSRLETSAWHAIEVDTKTGKPVENPTFAYGHEYYRERAAENGPKDHRNALAGEVAIIAATGATVVSGSDDHRSTAQSNDNLPDATTQGPPRDIRGKAQSAIRSTLDSLRGSSAQAGPIWPWAVALLAIVIVLALLIR